MLCHFIVGSYRFTYISINVQSGVYILLLITCNSSHFFSTTFFSYVCPSKCILCTIVDFKKRLNNIIKQLYSGPLVNGFRILACSRRIFIIKRTSFEFLEGDDFGDDTRAMDNLLAKYFDLCERLLYKAFINVQFARKFICPKTMGFCSQRVTSRERDSTRVFSFPIFFHVDVFYRWHLTLFSTRPILISFHRGIELTLNIWCSPSSISFMFCQSFLLSQF